MGIFFYNFFTWLYGIRARFVAPWNMKARLWLKGRKNLLPEIKNAVRSNQSAIIWMHCDSIGEYEQGLPMLEKLKQYYPAYKIIVTFFSTAGYEAKKNDKVADYIFYLPADSKKNAQEFINTINPKLALFVKNKYCFFYLEALKKRKVNTLLISGVFNEHQPFLKWYGNIYRLMLQCFTHIFVQTENSKKVLATIHISENVSVGGDTRFDRVIEIADQFEPIPLVEEFCGINNPVIVAGSTWEEDEEELDHYANTHAEIKFIIAPHDMDEENLQNVKRLFKRSVYFSELQNENIKYPNAPISNTQTSNQETPNVLIIDNIGMLSRLYKYATIAYVGGGFVDEGVHNVLEAAVYGKPVLFGPVIEDDIEALDLVECGGGIVVDSALEVEKTFNRLLINKEEIFACSEAAKNYVYSKKGATEKIINYIHEKRLLTN